MSDTTVETGTVPRFKIGDTVWIAEAHAHRLVDVPCPVCFGQRRLTLILGDGSKCEIPCEGCGSGCEGPRGVVQERRATSSVIQAEITAVLREGGAYQFRAGHHSKDVDFFTTPEEAEARRAELFVEAEKQAAENNEANYNNHKKGSGWTVRYHLGEAREARRRAEYHEGKARMLREDCR